MLHPRGQSDLKASIIVKSRKILAYDVTITFTVLPLASIFVLNKWPCPNVLGLKVLASALALFNVTATYQPLFVTDLITTVTTKHFSS